MALFRHFEPEFRVLVIAPRENIQRKWMKELGNFAKNNFRFPDLRVKSSAAVRRGQSSCAITSGLRPRSECGLTARFLLAHGLVQLRTGHGPEGWKTQRDNLRRELPWLAARYSLRVRRLSKTTSRARSAVASEVRPRDRGRGPQPEARLPYRRGCEEPRHGAGVRPIAGSDRQPALPWIRKAGQAGALPLRDADRRLIRAAVESVGRVRLGGPSQT